MTPKELKDASESVQLATIDKFVRDFGDIPDDYVEVLINSNYDIVKLRAFSDIVHPPEWVYETIAKEEKEKFRNILAYDGETPPHVIRHCILDEFNKLGSSRKCLISLLHHPYVTKDLAKLCVEKLVDSGEPTEFTTEVADALFKRRLEKQSMLDLYNWVRPKAQLVYHTIAANKSTPFELIEDLINELNKDQDISFLVLKELCNRKDLPANLIDSLSKLIAHLPIKNTEKFRPHRADGG
jgi:predicted transposase YdaD